ncbi:Fatty acid hydroxylase superfamily protein [Rhodobacteraceae bacterium THAF1]|uniref:sterol desaturase family protein n=1 Tax=Palleronia sp. THAF1 TaxID=2587842 RepID=UPI000F41B45A|nr:sterol desaturase family protein [Palleronia sp. THAF1]QFU08988.1 Fatty acid hydroxylase superfamily protein [Palleronia sp. THAF1]VDC24273.1 Fatty acid hydroxylase superfamily protein [Rhodobacteraceae bacterium THAF1]
MQAIYKIFFGPGEIIAPAYLAVSAVIAFVVWRLRKPGQSFAQWLLPRDIILHRSHRMDALLFVISRIMVASGVLARLVVTPAVAVWTGTTLGGLDLGLSPLAVALFLFLLTDFFQYWLHRAFHDVDAIWPIHAVHHSAEVLTPLTTYRQHPLAYVVSPLILSSGVGVCMGLMLGAAAPEVGFTTIMGVNAFLVASNACLANFRHSHVWIGFGPVLERIVISPAQHQIHHSIKAEHYDRNYGEVLAVWDWMFGTLYLTQGKEPVRFGLTGARDADLTRQHIVPILLSPVRRLLSGRG